MPGLFEKSREIRQAEIRRLSLVSKAREMGRVIYLPNYTEDTTLHNQTQLLLEARD